MKTAKIQFLFTFKGGGTMEATFSGVSEVSNDHAISLAWQAMAADNFDCNLINKTAKIEVLNIDLK